MRVRHHLKKYEKAVGTVAVVAIALTSFVVGHFTPPLHIGPPTIETVMVSRIESTMATFLFTTNVPTAGYVHISEQNPVDDERSIGGLRRSTVHVIDRTGLRPNTKYYYYVLAVDTVTGAESVSTTGWFVTKNK